MSEDKKKSQSVGPVIVSVLVIIILLLFVRSCGDCMGCGDSSTKTTRTTPKTTTVDLKTSVLFDGSQFIIVNLDDFDWTNVKLEVNSSGFKSGYILNTKKMEAGHTYTVGAMQFTKGDGTRFNPFTMKPLNFSIWCDTPEGNGFYYGELN